MKPMADEKIEVLVVDDSAVVRQSLSAILDEDPEIEVSGAVGDPYQAAARISRRVPDVITLDVEMPRMDGITFLKKLMSQHPIPVVICSSLVGDGCETTLKALEYGAVEIISKPRVGTKEFMEEARIQICEAVRAGARVDVSRRRPPMEIRPKLTADAVIAKRTSRAMAETTDKVVVVGASTGGTEALRILLESMPSNAPGMVIVQHMPENFTAAFAERLDSLCEISVKEAQNGDTVLQGRALIAPGNYHTLLKRSGARYFVEVREGPLVSRHRPSVDVLFRSACRYAGKNAVGVIMTGMGDDGAHGLAELREAEAHTIAQDEKSCVVFGMPAEAIKLGAAESIVPLGGIADKVLELCRH